MSTTKDKKDAASSRSKHWPFPFPDASSPDHVPMPSKNLQGSGVENTFVDEEYFLKLDYWQQWDKASKDIMLQGNASNVIPTLIHWTWHVILIAGLFTITHFCGGSEFSFGSKEYLDIFMKNVTVYYYFITNMGISGMLQGFMFLEIGPINPFWGRGSNYKFTPGTLKEPMKPFNNILWSERNYLDIALTCIQWGLCIMMLINPTPSGTVAAAYFGMQCWKLISNVPEFLSEDGYLHFAANCILAHRFYLGSADGCNAALQLFLLTVYFGCGIGKLGPWFAHVFAQEWASIPAFAGKKWMRDLMYKDVDGKEDYRLTWVATIMGLVAASIEGFAGLLIFLDFEKYTYDFGFSIFGFPAKLDPVIAAQLLVVMHAYIILHMPGFDVSQINYPPAIQWYLSTMVLSYGFDWEDFAKMPDTLWYFLLAQFVIAMYGQFDTKNIGYTFAFRFWAGNWPHAFFLVRDQKAYDKLMDNIVNFGPIGFEHCGPKVLPAPTDGMKAWVSKFLNCLRLQAFFWHAQPNMKNQPGLQKFALDYMKKTTDAPMERITDPRLVCHGISILNHLFGLGFNDMCRCEHALKLLQQKCKFEKGEVLFTLSNSFPIFSNLTGGSSSWEIRDLSEGLIASGNSTVAECVGYKRPSDSKELYDKMKAQYAKKSE